MDFKRIFSLDGVTEVISVAETETHVNVVHRVLRGALPKWLDIVEYVLLNKSGWDSHVSKQYFLKDGKLVYGWNFIIKFKEGDKIAVKEQLQGLLGQSSSYAAVRKRIGEKLNSYPLAATNPDRNAPGGPWNLKGSGPDTGGYRHRGAYQGLNKR
jgi:hypothetical protein